MSKYKLNRRRFLEGALAASTTGCSTKSGSHLSDAELNTLSSICDQMIPPDQDPGAAWAGVPNYITRQLRGPFREHVRAYRAGIAEADRRSGGSFASLSRPQQFEVLTAMERDPAARPFIALVAAHSMQGYFGSPRHGGNRDYCGWRMLGVPASPVRGRDQYRFDQEGSA